jgi:HEAT repeat protein
MTLASFRFEVALFRVWANSLPAAERRGEWEERYERGNTFRKEAMLFLETGDWTTWTEEVIEDVLYAIARDNEEENLIYIVAEAPECLLMLALVSVAKGERDARWQFADFLGEVFVGEPRAEEILLLLLRDDDEYVRRRALRSLARVGSTQTEHYCKIAWDSGNQYQRMMALEALHIIRSELLSTYLAQAMADSSTYLPGYARELLEKIGS